MSSRQYLFAGSWNSIPFWKDQIFVFWKVLQSPSNLVFFFFRKNRMIKIFKSDCSSNTWLWLPSSIWDRNDSIYLKSEPEIDKKTEIPEIDDSVGIFLEITKSSSIHPHGPGNRPGSPRCSRESDKSETLGCTYFFLQSTIAFSCWAMISVVATLEKSNKKISFGNFYLVTKFYFGARNRRAVPLDEIILWENIWVGAHQKFIWKSYPMSHSSNFVTTISIE